MLGVVGDCMCPVPSGPVTSVEIVQEGFINEGIDNCMTGFFEPGYEVNEIG